MLVRETDGVLEGHIRKLVRARLRSTGIVDLDGLAAFVGQDQESVAQAVDALIADGEVEVLRPVGQAAAGPGCRADGSFYRVIQATDRDYLWEKEVNTRPAREDHHEIKKAWLRMSEHEEDLDLSVLRLIHAMNMA